MEPVQTTPIRTPRSSPAQRTPYKRPQAQKRSVTRIAPTPVPKVIVPSPPTPNASARSEVDKPSKRLDKVHNGKLRRAKSRRTRAVFRRGKAAETLAPLKEEHQSAVIPRNLETIIRKPLNTAKTSRTKRTKAKTKAHKHKLLAFLAERLQASNSWDGKLIRPHAVLAWLEKAEPYNAEYLLKNASQLSYEDGEDSADPIFSGELDSIIARFEGSKIDNVALEHNSQVDVPKDYAMRGDAMTQLGDKDAKTFIVEDEEWFLHWQKMHSGRRPSKTVSETDEEDEEMQDALSKHIRNSQNATRALATVMEEPETPKKPKKSPKRTKSFPTPDKRGFDPVQVLRKHAISFEKTPLTPPVSGLDNDIHPIFKEENFHGCPQAIYDIFKPGLKLASLLLTHRATSSFWHTLCFGKEETQYNQSSKRIRNDVPWNATNQQIFEDTILAYEKSVHFHFALFPTADTKSYSYASMHPIRDYAIGWAPRSKSEEGCRPCRIRLSTDFYTTARKLSKLKNPDPAQVLRFNFFFAVNMVHEMAHFLWMSRWDTERHDLYSADDDIMTVRAIVDRPEPMINDQCFSELGVAFETKIFGGRIEPLGHRIDCLHGLTINDIQGLWGTPIKTFYTIPMEFMQRMQDKATWEKDYSKIDWKSFHVPRDGATSVSVPFFDMMVWKDEGALGDGGIVSDVGTARKTPWKRDKLGIFKVEDNAQTTTSSGTGSDEEATADAGAMK